MKTEEDYKKLSAWMLTVITHPKGVNVGAQVAANQNLLSDKIEIVIQASNRLSSVDRISIYQRAYYARLLECFQAEYPVLKHLLGAEIFKAFVFEYLQQYPSRSYTLKYLGAQFPAYLAQTQPKTSTANAKQANWVKLILDLAHLERSYMEVFDGPGHEKEQIPNANRLLQYDLDTFAKLKLIPANSLRLFAFQHNLLDYFLATRKGENPGQLPLPEPSWVALNRRQYNMRLLKLSPLDYQLLQSIFKGSSIKEALVQVQETLSQVPATSLIAIRSRICILAEEGFFKEII